MPRYREFYRIETVVNDAMEYLGTLVSLPIRDTPLEYWLLEREGQIGTFFFGFILGSLIWLICLDYSIRRSSKLVAVACNAEANVHREASEMVQTPAPSQNDKIAPTPATGDTPFMKKLAPPGHRPTNAQLDISPFHLARNLGQLPVLSASISSNPLAPPPQGRNFSGLFDTNSTPLCFGHSSEAENSGVPITSPPLQGQNFASLKRDAPVSYETLRERGLLDEDGSLTAKFRLHQLLGDESS